MGLLEDVQSEISNLTPDQLKAEFLKITEERAKRKEKQKEYNASPENKEKRKAYSEKYRRENPDKFKAVRAAYMKKPEVKARMKTYRDKRNARIKALVAAAKAAGLDTSSTPTA